MANLQTAEREAKDQTDNLRDRADDVKRKAQDAWDDFTDVVKRHPGKALGFTLAAGFAVGSIVAASASSRRRYSTTDQLKGMAGNGVDAWERLRSGFEEAACSLKDAVDDAVKKFK